MKRLGKIFHETYTHTNTLYIIKSSHQSGGISILTKLSEVFAKGNEFVKAQLTKDTRWWKASGKANVFKYYSQFDRLFVIHLKFFPL